MSRPYFADGPKLIRAIESHTYVIQPPGYWLYARVASLFPAPAFGLSFMNAAASALGALSFYLVAQHLTTRVVARLATAAYASIYFAWFAGATQSSYAGELLFPPLMFLFMLRYVKRPALLTLIGIAAWYALLSGVRPSDGVFMAPLFLYFVARYAKDWRHAGLIVCTAIVLSLGWYIPQHNALQRSGLDASSQLWGVAATKAPMLNGFSKLAISNIVRVVFPLALAFWSLGFLLFRSRLGPAQRMLWIWLLPGLAFFTLVYISDATYLCFLVAPVILLSLSATPRKLTYASLSICSLWNSLFFSVARPIDGAGSLPLAVYSVSGARYCGWALQHQWFRTLDQFTAVPEIGGQGPGARKQER